MNMNDHRHELARTAELETERSLLGILMRAPEKLDDIDLSEEDFGFEAHKLVFAAILRLAHNQVPVDIMTVMNTLDESNDLERIGGMAYLGAMLEGFGSAANIKRYASEVRERALGRRLADAALELHEMSVNANGESIEERVERGMDLLQAITTEVRGQEAVSIARSMHEALVQLDQRLKNPGALTGVPTGVPQLNVALMGYQKSDLIIVAGRPSMGKTSLVMQGAESAAAHGKRVLIFSLEMSKAQLAVRLSAGRAEVAVNRVIHGVMDEQEKDRLLTEMDAIKDWNLHIDDTGGLTVDQIRARAKRHAARRGCDLIVVDHLGLIKLPGKGNKASELGDVTSALKGLAKSLGVPVVLAVQLNRESAKGGSVRRPTMTDIRDSGRVEEDADVILLLHRPGYYSTEANPTEAEILIEKQRMGERGVVLNVGWRGELSRFSSSPDPSWRPAPPDPKYSFYKKPKPEDEI